MAENKANDVVTDFLKSVTEGSEHFIDVTRRIVGEKEEVSFSMSKQTLQPEQPYAPVRKESPKRAHRFFSVVSFVEFLAKYKTEDTIVLADVATSVIQAVLNDRAKNGFEEIAFTPQQHPLFTPWAFLIGKPVPIQLFAKFLQQNKKTVIEPDPTDLTLLFSQIRASQKITIHSGVGKTAINGLVCESKILGHDSKVEVDLPDTIKINVPIYVDTQAEEIEIDLLIEAKDTDVIVLCSSSDLDLKRVAAFEQMLAQVRTIEKLVVGFGVPQTAPWDYLRPT